MTPELAYEYLAPKLSISERHVLDVIYQQLTAAKERAEKTANLRSIAGAAWKRLADSLQRENAQLKIDNADLHKEIAEANKLAESAEQKLCEAQEQKPVAEKTANGIEWQFANTVHDMPIGTKIYSFPPTKQRS